MPPDPGGDADIRTYDDVDPSFTDDDGTVRCGVPKTTNGEPCRHPVPNSDCPTHGDRDARIDAVTDGDVQLPDGVGSGDPGHQQGDGQPPDGNKNAMTHGVYASRNDPWGTLDYLQDEAPQVYARVVRWFWDEALDAPFDVYTDGHIPDVPGDPTEDDGIPGIDVGRLTSRAADLLLVSLDRGITFNATMSQAKRGLAYEQTKATSDGAVQTIDENPVNLPKNRMRREDRAQLKDLGLRDDSPDAVAAQGQQDLAAAAERVAQRKDQDDGRSTDADDGQDGGGSE
jgi:hypothetical protein